MNKLIQTKLKELGLYFGKIDGIIGPKTKQAIIFYRRLNGMSVKDTLTLEQITEKPIKDRSDKTEPKHSFGEVGKNQVKITLPYKMKIAWQPEKLITRFSCHKLVKEKLEQVFEQTLDVYGKDQIEELGLDMFGGCLNVRKMRGGNRWSKHAWGTAVDIDPINNQLRWNDKKAKLAKPEYRKFWEIVENAGAFSLGRENNYDWMHFEFR